MIIYSKFSLISRLQINYRHIVWTILYGAYSKGEFHRCFSLTWVEAQPLSHGDSSDEFLRNIFCIHSIEMRGGTS